MGTGTTPEERDRLAAIGRARRARFLLDLERLVGIDSGTGDAAGVDAVAGWVMEHLEALGASVRRYPDPAMGDTYAATFEGPADGPSVLLLGHADTVFEPGASVARPFRIEATRAYGPGVLDMKGGLLLGLEALRSLRESAERAATWVPFRRLTFVINPDEEVGSPSSTAVIAELAADADVALDLEPARPNGDIVSARAGMTHLRIDISGRAAHAGVEPERGRSAVLEAAHKVIELHALNDLPNGLSVNAGMVRGGTRPNIVPDQASITVDLRARRRNEQESALATIGRLCRAVTVSGTTAKLEPLATHWPMERTEASEHLARLAVEVAHELGLDVADTATGGASDANTTAALGVPTIDGLGPVGGGAHTPDEYLELDSVGPRIALLAALLLAISRDRSFRPRA